MTFIPLPSVTFLPLTLELSLVVRREKRCCFVQIKNVLQGILGDNLSHICSPLLCWIQVLWSTFSTHWMPCYVKSLWDVAAARFSI